MKGDDVVDPKSFILGFLVGVLLIFLAFILIIYVTNRRFLKKSLQATEIDNEIIRKLISSKQKKIMKSPRIGFTNNFQLVQEETKILVLDIAKYYYPNSKYPHLEINFIEAIDMNERVLNRLKQILDLKVIGIMKNIRIAQIISILETKKNLENTKVYQLSKKYHLNKVLRYGYTALHVTNPGYWLRKVIFTSTLETTLRSVAVMTINIVGEEASRLYSKKILDSSDKLLDKELAKFVKEIEAS